VKTEQHFSSISFFTHYALSYLFESSRRFGPGLVQDVLGQFFSAFFQVRDAHVVEEVRVLFASGSLSVHETDDEPEKTSVCDRPVSVQHSDQARGQVFRFGRKYILGCQDFCFYCMFKTNFSGHNTISGYCLRMPPVATALMWAIKREAISLQSR